MLAQASYAAPFPNLEKNQSPQQVTDKKLVGIGAEMRRQIALVDGRLDISR